jgi:adenylate cyclase
MSKLILPVIDPEVEAKPEVSAAAIRRHLDRILASPPFLHSRRPSQFLRFVVERTLAGEGDRIKEYLIGLEVFKRSGDYDPKIDPIVRIEAGRLRKKLAEYYMGAGQNDPIVIGLPKGRYVPTFELPPAETKPESSDPPILATRRVKEANPLGASAIVLFLAIFAVLSAYYLRLHLRATVPTSIAVLPFLDLSACQAGAYLSEGISEEVTTGLSQLKGLRVVASTSAFQFRGKSEDVRKIGHALNAEALLEGSISQSGSGFRINAQLVDARNGYHLWSKAYDVKSTDLLSSEQDIVQDTARALRIPESANTHPVKRDTESSEAHDLYLQGRYLWNTRQLLDMLKSVQLFELAIRDDPNYALAYAGLADSYTVMAVNAQMSPEEALPQAHAALRRALALDPDLAQAYATLGLLKSQCEWDWQGAEQEFRKAMELEPNYGPAHHWAALNYKATGQFAAADAEFRQAQVLDPLSPMITEGLAENFFASRRYDEAISTVLHMPNPKVGWVTLARAYLAKGNYEEALKLPEVAAPVDFNGYLVRAEALLLSGDRPSALKIIDDLERHQVNPGTSHDYIPSGELARADAKAGEKERAYAWLEKAYRQHDPTLSNLKVDPDFDSLRSDQRYMDLLKKVGFRAAL